LHTAGTGKKEWDILGLYQFNKSHKDSTDVDRDYCQNQEIENIKITDNEAICFKPWFKFFNFSGSVPFKYGYDV